jgi:hypothetical protein
VREGVGGGRIEGSGEWTWSEADWSGVRCRILYTHGLPMRSLALNEPDDFT